MNCTIHLMRREGEVGAGKLRPLWRATIWPEDLGRAIPEGLATTLREFWQFEKKLGVSPTWPAQPECLHSTLRTTQSLSAPVGKIGPTALATRCTCTHVVSMQSEARRQQTALVPRSICRGVGVILCWGVGLILCWGDGVLVCDVWGRGESESGRGARACEGTPPHHHHVTCSPTARNGLLAGPVIVLYLWCRLGHITLPTNMYQFSGCGWLGRRTITTDWHSSEQPT
jgi:hypothetical protein